MRHLLSDAHEEKEFWQIYLLSHFTGTNNAKQTEIWLYKVEKKLISKIERADKQDRKIW